MASRRQPRRRKHQVRVEACTGSRITDGRWCRLSARKRDLFLKHAGGPLTDDRSPPNALKSSPLLYSKNVREMATGDMLFVPSGGGVSWRAKGDEANDDEVVAIRFCYVDASNFNSVKGQLPQYAAVEVRISACNLKVKASHGTRGDSSLNIECFADCLLGRYYPRGVTSHTEIRALGYQRVPAEGRNVLTHSRKTLSGLG